jgi:hypothetical protein
LYRSIRLVEGNNSIGPFLVSGCQKGQKKQILACWLVIASIFGAFYRSNRLSIHYVKLVSVIGGCGNVVRSLGWRPGPVDTASSQLLSYPSPLLPLMPTSPLIVVRIAN